MRFVIYGAGGFGRELVRPAQHQLARRISSGEDIRLAFAEDSPMEAVLGIEVIAPDSMSPHDEMVIAVGSSKARLDIAQRYPHVNVGSLIAQTSIIGTDVEIGAGAVLCDYTMITASARIGRHFQCNIYSYVAHDCNIGDFVTFAPRVCCNGNVVIEDEVYVGTGAVLKQGTADKPLIIGAGATVGMGAVVTKDVAPGTVVVGNPARILERN